MVTSSVVSITGPRALSPGAVRVVSSVVSGLLRRGSLISVGCCTGADQAAVSTAVSSDLASQLRVSAAFDPWGAGSCQSVSSVAGVQTAAVAGAVVSWLAGGPLTSSLRSRLARRSRAVVSASSGLVAFIAPAVGPGVRLSVCWAASCSIPVIGVLLPGASVQSLPSVPGCQWVQAVLPGWPPSFRLVQQVEAPGPIEISIPAGKRTRTVNVRSERCDVYIGRRGKGEEGYYGNPFVIGKDGTRDEVLAKFEQYFLNRIETDPEYRRRVLWLRGKRLGCFCHPQRCHGDVIAAWLDTQPIELTEADEPVQFVDRVDALNQPMTREITHVAADDTTTTETRTAVQAVQLIGKLDLPACPRCGACAGKPHTVACQDATEQGEERRFEQEIASQYMKDSQNREFQRMVPEAFRKVANRLWATERRPSSYWTREDWREVYSLARELASTRQPERPEIRTQTDDDRGFGSNDGGEFDTWIECIKQMSLEQAERDDWGKRLRLHQYIKRAQAA